MCIIGPIINNLSMELLISNTAKYEIKLLGSVVIKLKRTRLHLICKDKSLPYFCFKVINGLKKA